MPIAGWVFTLEFMIVNIAHGEDVVASNIPYVSVAYDVYKISADIAEADAAFEEQFFQNAEPLD